eukprot:Gb_34412 [translate_table: standard]
MRSISAAAAAWKCVFVLSFLLASGASDPTFKDVHVGIPVTIQLQFAPFVEASPGVRPGSLVACERVHIPGLPRFRNVKKYAHSFRLKVESSEAISQRYPQNIEVCLHQNESLGLGQCPQDEWKSLQKGSWSVTMSPYETKYMDIRITDTFSISVTVSIEEEFRPWRLVFLGSGLVMLFLAPIVSEWVPFYYSSAMALGIILVILMLLFQGMKLLPAGRKSAMYFAFYGSIVGLGSFIVHYLSGLVSSILQKLGLGEEMYNPVAVFLLVGIVLAGAWLGYWGVRKFVLSEDGSVDIGTAQFVKWAIRIVAIITILQSSHDPWFSLLAAVTGIASTSSVRLIWQRHLRSRPDELSLRMNQHIWRHKVKKAYANHAQAEFRSKLPKTEAEWPHFPATTLQQSPKSLYNRQSPRTHGLLLAAPKNTPSPSSSIDEQDHYSTFHKTPGRKRFLKEEWEKFTRESTRKAMNELVSRPEFSEWTVANADRIMVLPHENKDDSLSSSTESTDGTEQEESNEGVGWFGW